MGLDAVRRFRFGRSPAAAGDLTLAGSVAVPARPPGRLELNTFASLADPSFRWYFSSMAGWFASMNMQQLARGVIVFDMTGSYAALGLVSLASAIPGLALSLPGGLAADRIDRKLIIQLGQMANVLISGIIAALMFTELITFEHLVASAVFQGGINSLIMPARQAIVPQIIGGERLMNAVALNSAGTNVMRLAGPPVGGMLLSFMGPGWVYMTMAALYGFGAACMLPVRVPPEVKAAGAGRAQGGSGRGSAMLRDLAEGVRYMATDRVIFAILSTSFLIVLLSQPYQMLLPGFAKDVLGASPSQLGLLMSLTGLGALVGSLVIASLPGRRRGLMLLMSSLVMGVTTLAFALSTNILLTAGIVFAIGIGQSLRMSVSNVLIQSYTEPEYRGRVMSVYMMEFSLVAFGTFCVGILSNAIGVQAALAATAIGLVALSGLTLTFAPLMRRLH